MYERTTLGFSLKPPKIIRDAVNRVIGDVLGNAKIPVPTPSGTVVFTASSIPAAPAPDMPGASMSPLLIAGGLGLALLAITSARRGRR